jgi:S-adenosylmethionine:tRNA ribosyltransferase-isomerase
MILPKKQCNCTYTESPVTGWRTLHFDLPPGLEAGEPPEARGLARDQVRLLVSRYGNDDIQHTHFSELDHFLEAGDVLVINTSATMNAALPATRSGDSSFELRLSTRLPNELWSVEVRRVVGETTESFTDILPGETLELPAGGRARLVAPYQHGQYTGDRSRLWLAALELPLPLNSYIAEHGFPIRYSYVKEQWPLTYYQTVYATEVGSAEMPSAGRAFTPEVMSRLISRGVQIVPLILHTGVASLEEHEPPYEEFYRVPAATAQAINQARMAGKRIIAVGTTVIRALETVTDEEGIVHPGEGYTNLVITPQRRLHSVNGMLTGFHEPQATHLAMLEALAGLDHLCLTYQEALREGYLWHEFGDLHLLLP